MKEGETNSITKVHLKELMYYVAILPWKMKHSPSRYTVTTKRDKIPQKHKTEVC